MSELQNKARDLARALSSEADRIYAKMDPRAVEGGAVDDEAEMLYKMARRVNAVANEMLEFESA